MSRNLARLLRAVANWLDPQPERTIYYGWETSGNGTKVHR